MYCTVISFVLSLSITYIILPLVIEMLINSNILCENYKLLKIPTSVGVIFIFSQVMSLGLLSIFIGPNSQFIFIYLVGFILMGFLGLLDDLIGFKDIKGLKGHIKAMFKGILTTGAIKAILGLFISVIISNYISGSLKETILNSLIIGLFTNLLNIFDLRPGRAIKVFIVISIVFLVLSLTSEINYILFSFFGILIPYLFLDLRAKAMMGDVGSNVLGFTLGVYGVVNFDLVTRGIILIILVILHIIAEKTSFSKIIEHNKILKYLDDLGR